LLTLPEVTATLAYKERAPNGISTKLRDRAYAAFFADCQTQYRLHALTRERIDLAVELAQRRKLRGCDAIQLATAIDLNRARVAQALPPLIFVAADKDLVQAALEEGSRTENPIEYNESKKHD